jgi:hypothetical protein
MNKGCSKVNQTGGRPEPPQPGLEVWCDLHSLLQQPTKDDLGGLGVRCYSLSCRGDVTGDVKVMCWFRNLL